MYSTAQVQAETQPTMCWELHGSIFVIVHANLTPSDADYDAALRGYARYLDQFTGILVSTAGGGPNFAQRNRTTQFWKGKVVPTTVVMTSSPIVRGIITAMNWFLADSQIIATRFGDFPRASDILEVPGSDRGDLEEAVRRLHSHVGT